MGCIVTEIMSSSFSIHTHIQQNYVLYIHSSVEGWMDGLMDGWLDSCMDGWIDGWLVVGCLYGKTDG